jgi:acyl-coenzyme A thioesterase PaaI-like protein
MQQMAGQLEELERRLSAFPQPACAALTPFRVVEADLDAGEVAIEFDAQPAFGNHSGHIQGGFAVAMLDAVISIAAFAKLEAWLPTVEIKASFLAPLPVTGCRGEGRVIRAGRRIVFVEARLLANGEVAVTASATVIGKQS